MELQTTIGTICPKCKQGLIVYLKSTNQKESLELIHCSNPECKGHIDIQ